jgi:hypothetical protein
MRVCQTEGCGRPHHGHGFCFKCLRAERRGGRLVFKWCVTGCGRSAHDGGRGLCHACYARKRRAGEIYPLCAAPKCKGKALSRGLCGPCNGYVEAAPIKQIVRSRALSSDKTELVYVRDDLNQNIHYYARDYWTPEMTDRICTALRVWSGEYIDA